MLQSNNKAQPRFPLLFSKLQMVVLNDFVLSLKQESGSRDEKGIQQSVAREVESKGIFLTFFKFRKFS